MRQRKGRKIGGFDPDDMMRYYAEGKQYTKQSGRMMDSDELDKAADKWTRQHKKKRRKNRVKGFRFKKSNWV